MPRKSKLTVSNVVPFSPLSSGEEAVIDAYLKRRPNAAPNDLVLTTLDELGAQESLDIDRGAIEIGAGLIIGKYAGGSSLPNWSGFPNGKLEYARAIDDAARKARRLFSI